MGKKHAKKHGTRIGTYTSKSPKRDEDTLNTPVIPPLQNTQSVVVEEYTSNNGCKIVRIGLPPRVVVGEELPADYDLGITVIEPDVIAIDDDHLSQKQKAQKRGYLSWLFWR
jgi:hypothetical protein